MSAEFLIFWWRAFVTVGAGTAVIMALVVLAVWIDSLFNRKNDKAIGFCKHSKYQDGDFCADCQIESSKRGKHGS